jgi:hypothetical protein
MHKPLSHPQIALLCAMVMAFVCLHTRANAQETTTFNVYARISDTTCLLKISDTNGGYQFGGTRSITLPNVSSFVSGTSVGSPLGSYVTIEFRPVNPTSTDSNCYQPPINGISNNWDLALVLDASQITTLSNGHTYLTNAISVAAGGTDAVLMLKGNIKNSNQPQQLALKTGGVNSYGTLVSGSNSVGSSGTTNVGISQYLQLQVQLTQAGNSEPKAGSFKQTIPLMLVYQ